MGHQFLKWSWEVLRKKGTCCSCTCRAQSARYIWSFGKIHVPLILVPFTRMYSPKPSLGLWKKPGCVWRGLGGLCLGWCHQVFVWSRMSQRCFENPLMRRPQDFCWILSSALLAGVCKHWGHWLSKHFVKIILKSKSVSHSPSWLSPFSKGKSFFTFCFWIKHCSDDRSLSLSLAPQSNVLFSVESFHWSSQTETHSMVPYQGNFSPSPWPAAATVSAEFLHKESAERKYFWDWQSKRSFYNGVTATGHVKTEPECNHPTMKSFSSQFA